MKRAVLQFNIAHTFAGDLDITLKSPANTTIDVTSDNGSSGYNYTNTSFNDACGAAVATRAAPFARCYFPGLRKVYPRAG